MIISNVLSIENCRALTPPSVWNCYRTAHKRQHAGAFSTCVVYYWCCNCVTLPGFLQSRDSGFFISRNGGSRICHAHKVEKKIKWDRYKKLWSLDTRWASVQFSSVSQSCPTLCDPMNRSTPGLPVYHQLPELTETHVHWVGDAIQPSHPLSPLLLPPSIFPNIRVFSNESVLRIGWPKYWSFSFNISPCNEHSGLISFRMDWLDLFAVQGTLKSLLQHHSLKASILLHSAFFIVQLSHLYMTTGKTIALTRRTFVGKVMSLLFNILSRLVIAFPRSKRLNFVAAITICSDLGAPKNKVFHCFPIYLPWRWA